MSEPIWVEDDLVLAIHDRLLVEHGGAEGVRCASLLPPALGSPLNHIAYAARTLLNCRQVHGGHRTESFLC